MIIWETLNEVSKQGLVVGIPYRGVVSPSCCKKNAVRTYT